ncbi:hypothetical protein CHS0354_018562 [Potamilus streckersoni]|uniref:Filament cap protein n=1 Tax=Potamilus streckersoni TaxID=2493646 RepID=A0AAE0TAU6_9BIVA|nr:hypothetical protein CHS0354_018562 [Potamilus streckersoni]
MPSYHEGFGLPILEAMSCGTCVIGSNTTSIPEVLNFPEALFDPYEPVSIHADIRHIAYAIDLNNTVKHRNKRLYVDISELVKRDAKTGIQRVTRSILNELLKNPPPEYEVYPVYAETTYVGYRHANTYIKKIYSAGGVNPNGKGLIGFNGQIDTTEVINKIVEAESKRTEPVKAHIDKRQKEVDAWTQIKTLMENVRGKSDTLSKFNTWENKLATSSMPDVMTVKATKDAKPGKTNIAVDKTALNHQVISNMIPDGKADIGYGKIKIQIGYEDPKEIDIEPGMKVDDVVKKINESDLGVEAAIIQADDTGENFQMVLTSKQKGWKGRMTIEFGLTSGKYALDFNSFYTQPDGWVFKNRELAKPETIQEGDSSTSVPTFSGNYVGEEDLEIKFSAINSGTVGAENQLKVKWEDNLGRSGELDLSSFAYSPNRDVMITDGIYVRFPKGTIVQNEQFTVKAKPDESGLWYVPDDEEPSKIYKPTPWKKIEEMPAAKISGKFTGDDDMYYFTVRKSGIIGKSESVIVDYYSDNGQKGELLLGAGYKPGTEIDIGQGLKISFASGTLLKDASTSFEAMEKRSGIFWWLNNGDDIEPETTKPLAWTFPDEEPGEMSLNPADLRDRTDKKSNVKPVISGYYTGNQQKTYTFTVEGNGTVGQSEILNLRWKVSLGGEGRLKIINTYTAGDALEFDEGLSISVPTGELTDGDYLTFEAFSPVIQAAQDAVIRLNATPEGGGLTLRSSDNIFKDAIEGLTLETVKSSKDIVTITVENDANTPKTAIKDFVQNYNDLLGYLREASKYDPQTKIAGPLQADNNVSFIRDALSRMMIDTVKGLPTEANMSTYAGITFNKEGKLDFDEKKFDEKLSDNILKVAKIFSIASDASIKGLQLIDLTEKTNVNGSELALAITQLPTKGVYTSGVLGDYVLINEDNDTYKFEINGRETNDTKIVHGVYSRKEFRDMIDKLLHKDEALSKTKFNVLLQEDRLVIEADTYGSNSEVKVTTPLDINSYNEEFALVTGVSVKGEDIKANLEGIELEGAGKILRGVQGTRFEGLRLFADIDPDKIKPEEMNGTLRLTKGIAARTSEYFANQLNKGTGVNKRLSDINDRISDQKKQLDKINEGINRKKDDLVKRFGAMESAVSGLRAQQSNIQGQLASLS